MLKRKRRWLLLLNFFAIILEFALLGCEPARPHNVPLDAVLVGGGETRVWQYCTYDPKEDVNRCKIFNVGGGLLSDGVFLPYDGGKALRPTELAVDNETHLKGLYYVCLKNGRILVPMSDLDNQRRFIDWKTGKSKTR